MKLIKTVDAAGHILCHDITRIVKDVTKDAAFRKGHVVKEEDIPLLLSMGKESLYVWEAQEGMLHENEAAQILYDLCAGEHMSPTPVKEGKIEVIADCPGVLMVDTKKLQKVNSLGEMMIATRHSNFPVQKGDKLAGTRIIPLVIKEQKIIKAQELCGGEPILSLHPYQTKRIGCIVTGSEVYHGRIADTFTPVIAGKLAECGAAITQRIQLPDDHASITQSILSLIEEGMDMVICTGGMSVDPDDRTSLAIRNTGGRVVSYGAPVLPGAMFLLAYCNDTIPVVGLPGCVMYAKRTIFDLVLPRLMADVPVTKEDLAVLGHGGLCLSCNPCTYPNCGFGKGY